ncbi:Cytochrome P450 734A2 [Morus notabilis]|uniref:Cytochrome P450 734A2 n=1 Tax=Morus notabilis TaxID=981085 RepID=W9SDL1_9ROSA|nr:cytochrome P450 714C2 [Morus notabilis]EXC36468.1 Cytochrome P450 734A2 [Morus notabilis]
MEAVLAMMALTVLFGGFVLYLYNNMVLEPGRMRSKLQKQGVRGPSPSIPLGSIPEMKKIQLQVRSRTNTPNDRLYDVVSIGHDWPSTVLSHLIQWRNEYGPVFMYELGNMQFLCITDAEMVKEVSVYTSLNLGKPSYLSKEHGSLLGQGIISSSGPIWAHQKKIIAPEFYLDKVKGMVSLMVDSTNFMLRTWGSRIKSEGGVADIKVDEDLRSLSADIISRACFGSSYSQGEHIFSKLRTLQKMMSKRILGIPFLRFIPTKNNIDIWRLEKEIHTMILKVVKQRTEEAAEEKDLLQMILQGATASGGIDNPPLGITRDKFIVDNCKNIYFAGHETTAITASWSLMLLAAYPVWQTRVRAEVQEICNGGSIPHADMLRSMKVLTMVIQETLRLYPPGVFVSRKALQDIQLKEILIPKEMHIQIPISILHQDTDLWGPDAHQFNPERFEHGILGACKLPQAFIPFGVGTRICVGQHLAMIELKVILSLILSKLCFSMSPAYRHSPAFKLVIEPEHGINLRVERI